MRGANIREPADGDPSLMLVPPSTQYIDRAVVSTLPPLATSLRDPAGYTLKGFASLIAKASEIGSMRMDDQPLSVAWRTIGDGTYAGARFSIAKGSHVIRSVKPGAKFMAFSYGYGPYDSYSLPLGMQFTRSGCKPTRTQPGDGVDNDCDGVEGEERKNGLDDDGDGLKDEDLALKQEPIATNHAPIVPSATYPDFAGSMSFVLPGYDPDGDALSYRILSAPSGTTNLSGARLTFTGTAPSSGATFSFVANDGHADSAPATLKLLPANNNPCADPLQFTSNRCNELPYTWGGDLGAQVIKVPPGQLLAYSSKANGVDVDLQKVRYTLVSGPNGLRMDENTGIVT